MKDSKDLINKFVEEARALQKKYEELGTMVFAGDCEQEIAVVLSQGTREKVLDVMSVTIRSSMPIAEMLVNAHIVAVLDALEGIVSEKEFNYIKALCSEFKELTMKILVDNVPSTARVCKDENISSALEELKAINLVRHSPIGEA